MKIPFLFWLCLASVMAAIPVMFINIYAKTKRIYLILLAISCYLILILAYSFILGHRNIINIYAIVKILSIILITIFSYLFFHINIDSRTIIGLVLGILSIYVLSYKL